MAKRVTKMTKMAVAESLRDVTKVVGYSRVSTEEQEASGLSLLEQQTSIENFCTYRGLQIIDYEKEVISGSVKARERPKLAKLLEKIDKGEASGIVVSRLDRLGRGAVDTITLVDELDNKGVKFYSVQENIDCTTDIGRAMIRLLCVVANLERDTIRSRIRTVMQGKKERGEQYSQAAFGKMGVMNEKGVKILVPNPDEIETIRLTHQLRKTLVTKSLRNGKKKVQPMTYIAIAEELIKRGRKNRNGEVKWFPSQVSSMLKTEIPDEPEKPMIPSSIPVTAYDSDDEEIPPPPPILQ